MNGAVPVTSALVSRAGSITHPTRGPSATGRNELGNVIAATAVVTADWSAARCGLKPIPIESVATYST